MKKKDILLLGIVITIIAIIIIITIIVKNSKEEIVNTIIDDEGNIDESNIQINYSIHKVKDATKFYTVSNCVKKYVDAIKSKNINSIYNLIDRKYILNNNLDKSNILNHVNNKNVGKNSQIIIEDMTYIDGEIYEQYAVFLKVDSNANLFVKVNIDTNNQTFAIIPILDDNIKDLSFINLINTLEHIEKNSDNTFEYERYTDEDMAYKYFDYYKKLMYSDINKAYQMLDSEYREKRFPTIDEFKKYANRVKNRMNTAIIIKYSTQNNNEYDRYVLVDNFNNYYIIKEKGVMDFTIQLDNYTIKSEDYEEEYSKLDEEEKLSTNLNIFISMLNNKDYIAIYNHLDESFKKTNFPTIEDLKKYIDNNFFDNNIISTSNIKNEGNIFIYKLVIKSGNTRGAYENDITIIMKLGEGTDFVMSFSFN